MTTSDLPETDITEILGTDQKSSHKKWRWLISVILAVIFVSIVAVFVLSGQSETRGIQYDKKMVERGDLVNTVSATGNLEPTNQVDVGSELSGIVSRVWVDYNDTVTVGQVLAELDTAKLEAKVKQSQAALEVAEARVIQAKATVRETKAKRERMKQAREMSGGKIPSLYDIEAAEASYERAEADLISAQASVTEARATLASNKEDLSKAKILSPIDGVVLNREIEPGQTVAASLQAPVLFTLAQDLTQMELHVDVDEADVGLVHAGQKASFTVDAFPDRTFAAEIIQVRYGAQTSEGVVTYETVLRVNNSELLLRPGMTATADIIVQKVENKVLVPNAALRFQPPVLTSGGKGQSSSNTNSSVISKIMPRPPRHSSQNREQKTAALRGSKQQIVYIEEAGRLRKVPLVTGISNGIMTEVVEGELEPGQEVVVNMVSQTQ
ncbi:efflux RND transporter periplasmic adaptor subunit [bacterium]|nr:efflux RND transporter periplasmic adaptor subunit [bacterium]